MSGIEDIVISRIPFDGDRFKPAKDIARAIKAYLAEQRIDHFISKPETIDIPTSANMQDKTCLVFMRMANDRDHQMFIDRFNARIGFRGKTLIMRLGCEKPKGWSAMYETYELAWSSYPRNGEPKHNNQSKHEPFQARGIKFEARRGKNDAGVRELWSDDEDNSKTTCCEQAKKVEAVIRELSKINVRNKELEQKLKDAEQGRTKAETEVAQLKSSAAEQFARYEALEIKLIEAEQGRERA